MNDLIVRKIKEARIERGLTQKDLADHLGRTSAAISDLERGKVQVSASDLYSISQRLNKHIEFFFGEERNEKEIQDYIFVMRNQTTEARLNALKTNSMLLRLINIGKEIEKGSKGKQILIKLLEDFFSNFIPLSQSINTMTAQLN
jgi:transcriptional regulator with XRE-family HTH domain